MVRSRRKRDSAVITSADWSFEDEQRERKRVYTILMVVHILGFTVAGLVLMAQLWWFALALIAVTGPLPWIAVVLANDRHKPRRERTQTLPRSGSTLPSGSQRP